MGAVAATGAGRLGIPLHKTALSTELPKSQSRRSNSTSGPAPFSQRCSDLEDRQMENITPPPELTFSRPALSQLGVPSWGRVSPSPACWGNREPPAEGGIPRHPRNGGSPPSPGAPGGKQQRPGKLEQAQPGLLPVSQPRRGLLQTKGQKNKAPLCKLCMEKPAETRRQGDFRASGGVISILFIYIPSF